MEINRNHQQECAYKKLHVLEKGELTGIGGEILKTDQSITSTILLKAAPSAFIGFDFV
jgi:hypothetical protein